MIALPDLFGETATPGLSISSDVIGPPQEDELAARIDAESLSPFRFQHWTGSNCAVRCARLVPMII